MKLAVSFTVDVDFTEGIVGLAVVSNPARLAQVEAAVVEAVTHAIRHGEQEGHCHSMEGDISIIMDSEVSAKAITDRV